MLYFPPSDPSKFVILNDPALEMNFKTNKICLEFVELDINALKSLGFSTSTTHGCRWFVRNFHQSSKIEFLKPTLIMFLIRLVRCRWFTSHSR